MQPRRPVQLLARAVAASFITAVAVTAISPMSTSAAAVPEAGAPPCEAWTGGPQPPDPGGTDHNNYLRGVAVLSPCDAWAVGDYDPGQTLIVHWDGAAWTQAPSPNPGTQASLEAVTPVSASNVWAVGQYFDGTTYRTLTVHWDGSAWTQVTSPNAGAVVNNLAAVRGTSATNAWAVGYFNNNANRAQTLILHWNGTAWKQVTTPNPGGAAQDNQLTSVAVTPAGDAWAAGQFTTGPTRMQQPLVLHWTGSAWLREPTPSLGDDTLTAVGGSPDGSVWTVGHYFNGSVEQTLAIHCC